MAQKITIPNVRFSYAHVFQPYAFKGDIKEPKYSVAILIPKTATDTVAKIKAAINAAYEEAKVQLWGNKEVTKWFDPLQDGDTPNDDGDARDKAYAGHWFINAKSRTKPGLVDKNLQPILDSDEFYSGCYGHVSVAFSGYDKSGSKGISAFLNNIMKTKDGTPLGSGASTPEEDFADLASDDIDDL